ncbi:hypothetical protein BCY86_03040 [Pajaroellobacter abortibovis]|uniref:Uncharacterized protein n=1 Tax=Pajaroellobacter abortibovis TaxID=1882918 RepID=A0A1L6MWB6_9BACT|nr:hypothetical protein BCY86_03040 [Pajaroellobacter abortibovis]
MMPNCICSAFPNGLTQKRDFLDEDQSFFQKSKSWVLLLHTGSRKETFPLLSFFSFPAFFSFRQ